MSESLDLSLFPKQVLEELLVLAEVEEKTKEVSL